MNGYKFEVNTNYDFWYNMLNTMLSFLAFSIYGKRQHE